MSSSTKTESIRIDRSVDSFLIQFVLERNFPEPQLLIRNICIDACKALKLLWCEKCLQTIRIPYYKLYQIGLKGNGRIENGFFSNKVPEIKLAKLAADYLVFSQTGATGGWMINITRKFDRTGKISIQPGWYSAMAQGQAISLLCRLYNTTMKRSYLNAASNALKLFQVDVKLGGISTKFLNDESVVWFEEYPTKPASLYVLNGFIYSIFRHRRLFAFLSRSNTTKFRFF